VAHFLSFQLEDEFVNSIPEPQLGFGELGAFTFLRTYSRVKPDGTKESFRDVIKRCVEGSFSLQKDHILSHHLSWDEGKATKAAQTMFSHMMNLYFLPPGRGLWMMGTEYAHTRTPAGLFNCFSGDTEVLTRHGTKEIQNLVGTEPFLLTSAGTWTSAPVRSYGFQSLYELTLTRQGIHKTIRVTKDHKWYAQHGHKVRRGHSFDELTTLELEEGMWLRYQLAQPAGKPSPQGIQHGISFGDGTGTSLSLVGEKQDLLHYYSANDKYPEEERNIIRVIDLPEHFKDKPDLSWDRKYLLGWLMGYFAADGSVDNGQVTLSSSRKENLELVRDVASIIGIGTYSIRFSSGSSNYKEDRELWDITFMRDTFPEGFFLRKKHSEKAGNKDTPRRNWNVVSVKDLGVEEEVFCAEVPTTQNFTLEGNILTHNCAFTSTRNIAKEYESPFTFLMDVSMLGVGCGFDVKGESKVEIHKPTGEAKNFVIGDSREGWVESTGALIRSYIHPTDNHQLLFDYSGIRARHTLIKGFGGVAGGPESLIQLHWDLREMFDRAIEADKKHMDSRMITDIMNLLGSCVVSGNVRRVAELALGFPDDEDYLDLKNYEINPERKGYGKYSNNSVFCQVGMDYSSLIERTAINGEPGMFWLDNVRRFGRMGDDENNRDALVKGANPCMEQSLEDKEMCNLVEIFPTNIPDYVSFEDVLKSAYLYGKSVTLTKTHIPETNQKQLKNRRIGISLSGLAMFKESRGMNTMIEWMDRGYKFLKATDTQYSKWLTIPESVKLTSIKPSGTISLVAGVTAGVHYPVAKHYYKNIRVSSHLPLVDKCRELGYKVEWEIKYKDDPSSLTGFSSYESDDTVVIAFPVNIPVNIRGRSEISVWEQVKFVELVQRYWADNQVSCTVTFQDFEKDDLVRVLEMFDRSLKNVSFLPLFDSGYEQMPEEKVNPEDFQKYVTGIVPYAFASEYIKGEAKGETGCDNEGGSCSL